LALPVVAVCPSDDPCSTRVSRITIVAFMCHAFLLRLGFFRRRR
jgi:hypothetical protein